MRSRLARPSRRTRPSRPFTTVCAAALAGAILIPAGAGHGDAVEYSTASRSIAPADAATSSLNGAVLGSSLPQRPHPEAAASTLTRRQRVVNQVNARRKNRGLRPLSMAPKPRRTARWQSNHQASIRTVTHRGPQGGNAGNRLNYAQYPWWMWGEAVAGGYSKPKAVVNAWMNSPSHRDILMDPKARHIGVWSVPSGGRRYWTLVVANR